MGELTARIQELLAGGRTAGRVKGGEGPHRVAHGISVGRAQPTVSPPRRA
jgi:hypothetical protein